MLLVGTETKQVEMAASCLYADIDAAKTSPRPSTRLLLRLASIDPPDDDDSAVGRPDDGDDEGDEDEEDEENDDYSTGSTALRNHLHG